MVLPQTDELEIAQQPKGLLVALNKMDVKCGRR